MKNTVKVFNHIPMPNGLFMLPSSGSSPPPPLTDALPPKLWRVRTAGDAPVVNWSIRIKMYQFANSISLATHIEKSHTYLAAERRRSDRACCTSWPWTSATSDRSRSSSGPRTTRCVRCWSATPSTHRSASPVRTLQPISLLCMAHSSGAGIFCLHKYTRTHTYSHKARFY